MARRRKKDTSSLVGLILLITLVGLMVSFNYRLSKEREGNKEQIQNLKGELEMVRERKLDLETSLDKVEDKEYIERVLREDFLMKKPEEEKVVILTEKEEKELEEQDEEVGQFKKIKDWLPFTD